MQPSGPGPSRIGDILPLLVREGFEKAWKRFPGPIPSAVSLGVRCLGSAVPCAGYLAGPMAFPPGIIVVRATSP